LEEMAYQGANIDKAFWTPERLEETFRLEEKARLRALVLSAGRVELLKKQKEMLEEQQAVVKGEVPRPASAPSNKVLRNEKAQEQEGARLLLQNPTNFFVFDGSTVDHTDSSMSKGNTDTSTAYSGPSLGSPVGLRDRLRENSPQNRVFPNILGKYPKPDKRTEREKKQQEREEKMWAAAQIAKHSEGQTKEMEIELAAKEQTIEDLGPGIDYNAEGWDSDDEEWVQGLDPDADEEIINTPREHRYSEADIDWVLTKLEGKVKHHEKQLSFDIELLKQHAKPGFQPSGQAIASDDLEAALLSLSDKELLLLSDLDDTHEQMSPDEFSDTVKAIGLTEDQVSFILRRDRSH
jgi:hypothetical protein